MGKKKKEIEDIRTISEIEKENSDLLSKNDKHQGDIDKLLERIKGIRKIAKKNRAKITVNKNIVKKRLSDTYREFNVGDKIEFDVPKNNMGYFWVGTLDVLSREPYVIVTKVNKSSVRVDYHTTWSRSMKNQNISKDRLRQCILERTNLISKKAITRDEDIDKMLNI